MSTPTSNKSNKAKKPLVILVHGMGATSSHFDTLILNPSLKNYHTFIPKNRNGNTFEKSIGDQAGILSEEIEDYINEKNIHENEIIFLGHSQGGLVIMHFIKNLILRKKSNIIKNIKGVCTIGTPWDGVSLIKKAKRHKVIEENSKGTLDMIPNCQSLLDIKNVFDFKDIEHIKFFPIAGKIRNFSKALLNIQLKIKAFILKTYNIFVKTPIINNNIIDDIISYITSIEHDCIVNIESQLGIDTIPERYLYLFDTSDGYNIANISNKRLIIDNLLHDKLENMIPTPSRVFKGRLSRILRSLLLFPLKKNTPQLESEKFISHFVKFIDSVAKDVKKNEY